MICVHVKYSLPTKATGHMQTMWMLVLKDTLSRPQKVSISSNFMETEKVKENEKQMNLSQLKEQEKTMGGKI